MTNPSPGGSLKMILAFAMIYIVWGSTYLAIAFAIDTIPPFLTIGSRFLFAGMVLYGFLRLKGIKRPPLKRTVNGALIGIFTLGIGTGLIAWAEQYIDSGFVALIITAVPLWLVLLDWKMLKGGAPTRPVIFGLILGFCGIVILTGPEIISGAQDSSAMAVFAVLAATLSWSAGSLRSKMIAMPENLFMSSAIQMAAGGAVMGLLGLALGEWSVFEWGAISEQSAWAWWYLVIFGSLVAFSAYVWLLANAPPKQISSYAFVNPVVAVFLGWWLAGEAVNARILIAIVIMVSAVSLIILYGGKPRVKKDLS